MYDIVRRGYIEVWRVEGVARSFLSRHVDEAEAISSANNHGEANGGGHYLLVYPNKEVDVRIVIQGPAPTVPVITALPVTGSGTELDIELITPSTGPAAPYTYSLEEATAGGGPYTQIASGAIFTGSPLRYRRSGLAQLITRFYRAVGYDSASPQRLSAPSAISSATTHDVTPAAISFTNISGAAQSALIESNDIVVSGITTSVPISVTGGAYRINGGAWVTAPGTVGNGATVRVRTTSASSPDTPVSVTLTISSLSVIWTVRTASVGISISWPVHNPTYPQGPPAIPGHAFPGADSYGGGGRSSPDAPGTPRTTIIFIDNFNNGSAAGSAEPAWGPNVFRGNWRFAWGSTASPKVIIPLTGGWLNFGDNPASPNNLNNWSFWGQFAPQPGFFLRACSPSVSGGSNIQIWHLRSYVGDDPDTTGGGYGADQRDGIIFNGAGVTNSPTERNLLINSELFWSIDETASAFFSFAEMTHLYNVYADPLHRSVLLHAGDPPGTDHGFGPIFGGASGGSQPDRLVMMRNVLARQTGRNPLHNAQNFTFANNIVYDATQNAVHWHATNSLAMFANVLGNFFLRGPDNGASLRAVACDVTVNANSRTHLNFNSQHGWSAPANQLGFVTNQPFAGWSTNTLQASALPAFWGDAALDGILKWAINPLAPTTAERIALIALLESSCGAQPSKRTSGIGRVTPLFDRMRDSANGVVNPAEYGDTVTDYGGWFSVPTVGPINPLAPGSHWHAPLPTGADRDDTLGSTTLNNGLVVSGYTRLEIWALNQHIFVGGFVPTSVPGTLYSGFTPTLYAAPASIGNGSGSSEANARALTLILADTALPPGTIVGMAPGIYAGAANDTRWEPVFRPRHNGTLANPIRYCAKHAAVRNRSTPSLLCEFRLTNPLPIPSPDNNPVLGVDQAFGDHVHFYGVYANQVFAPPRPSNGTFLISPGRVGTRFADFWLQQTVNPDDDNWDSIFLEGSVDPVLSNGYISGGNGSTANNNHNASAITTYGCRGFLFEYLEFDNVNQAFFIKGSSNGATIWNSGTIRFCKSKNHHVAMVDIAEVHPGENVVIQQCLSIGGTAGVRFAVDGNAARQINKHVINCTIVGFAPLGGISGGITAHGGAMTGYQVKNTIVQQASGSHHVVDYQGFSTSGTSPLDNNHYHKQTGNATFQQSGSGALTLAQWKASTGKEAASTEGNPLFVNPASDDYHLQAGSPALTGSDVGGARGCYITGTEIIGADD